MTGTAENEPEARAVCEHFYASHCYRGMSVRLCMTCHEPDWDDLAGQLATPTVKASTHWAVAWGSKDVNDGIGYVELYDDEEDAREHVLADEGGLVVRRTVISLPWETVRDGKEHPDG